MILGLVITGNIVRPIRMLNHAAAQRRQLIADSAHELCTPISLIQARIEIMEDDGPGIAAENRERVFLSLTSELISPEGGILVARALDFQFAARLPGSMEVT